jgi:hypothetical protein
MWGLPLRAFGVFAEVPAAARLRLMAWGVAWAAGEQ